MTAPRLLPLGFVLFLASCSIENTAMLTKPTGDRCDVRLEQFAEPINAELLALDDDAVYVLGPRSVMRLPYETISQISVIGYSNLSEKVFINGIPGVLWIVGAVAAFSANESGLGGTNVSVALLPLGIGALNIAAMLSNPKTSFSRPMSFGDRDRLRLFARYQAGLTPGQWKQVLAMYEQSEFAGPP